MRVAHPDKFWTAVDYSISEGKNEQSCERTNPTGQPRRLYHSVGFRRLNTTNTLCSILSLGRKSIPSSGNGMEWMA